MMKNFVRLEAFAGILLGLAALFALIVVNSPASWIYDLILGTKITVGVGSLEISKASLLWINDGLMAIFILLVGLEIKREVVEGQLSSVKKFALPAFAALGGIIAPALIYLSINSGVPANTNGWAIPTATDIAFALGVIMLLGSRVPMGVKVTLVAVAILDDLAAISIIAIFYTSKLSMGALGFAAVILAILLVLNLRNVTARAPYMILGVILWVAVLKSGVHATLAGVAVALMIPMKGPGGFSPLKKLEHALHPWVAYMILPVFAFANAGIPLLGLGMNDLVAPLPLGIAVGLLIGKPLGVMILSFIAIKIGAASLPENTNWGQYFGMAILTGIGFTMSLFIGSLAFDDLSMQNAVRMGVLVGSILAGVIGAFILMKASKADI